MTFDHLFLHESRRLRGFTLQELADRAELSKSYLSELEAGRQIPSIKVANRLAEALGVASKALWREAIDV